MLVFVPPVRAFAMTDDWTYMRSVADILNGAYRPNDWAQASSVGHFLWGALFAWIFGFSFTTLTAATLCMAALAVGALYALLRHLGLDGGRASLGAALLG